MLKGNSSLPSPEPRFRTCRAHRPSKRQPAESKQYTPAKGPWSEPRCRPFPVAPQTVVTPLGRHSRTGSSWGQWRSLRHQRMQAPTSIPIRIPVSMCGDTVEGPGAQGGTQTGPCCKPQKLWPGHRGNRGCCQATEATEATEAVARRGHRGCGCSEARKRCSHNTAHCCGVRAATSSAGKHRIWYEWGQEDTK